MLTWTSEHCSIIKGVGWCTMGRICTPCCHCWQSCRHKMPTSEKLPRNFG